MTKLKEQETLNKTITKENQFLKSTVNALDSHVKKLQSLCNDMDQYSQRECVEIRGIPVSEHEDTNKIVVRVGELMGVEIKEDDISVSYRLPTSSKYKLKVKSPYLLLLLSLSDIMLKKDISRAINNSRTIQHVTLAFHSRGVSS